MKIKKISAANDSMYEPPKKFSTVERDFIRFLEARQGSASTQSDQQVLPEVEICLKQQTIEGIFK